MIHAQYQPNIPSQSGQKVDFIGFATFSISSHLRFLIRLNFLILKPSSLIMLHVKFKNHRCSGFREIVNGQTAEWTDGCFDERMENGCLYCTLKQVRQNSSSLKHLLYDKLKTQLSINAI